MNLKYLIKKSFFWQFLIKIKYYNYYLNQNKIKKEFNGIILNSQIQNNIQNIIKSCKNIYYKNEKTARKIANRWNGEINVPKKLNYIENSIPVVLSANEYFAPFLSVMLQSILDKSNPNRKYHFIIFELDFKDSTKELLKEQVINFKNCYLDFINTEYSYKEIPISLYKSHFSMDIFSRFFIPYWLDKYKKVIYCDSDMILKTDIAELYDLDIQDYCIAAAANQTIGYYLSNKKYSSLLSSAAFSILNNWHRYINSGLLVYNIDKFKELFSYKDWFRFSIYYTNRYKKIFPDQDIISLLIKENYFLLPSEWNYCWAIPRGKDNLPYQKANSDIKIIHFTGKIKPWNNSQEIKNNPDAILYKEYANNIPLYKKYLESNKQ